MHEKVDEVQTSELPPVVDGGCKMSSVFAEFFLACLLVACATASGQSNATSSGHSDPSNTAHQPSSPAMANQVLGVVSGMELLSRLPESIIHPEPLRARVAVQRIRIAQGVTQGMVLHRVAPVYPPEAKRARVEGSVVLAAIIGKDGSIANLTVVSGPTVLIDAAIAAVQQWRYRPYVLNGEPVEVHTTVTVNFQLQPF